MSGVYSTPPRYEYPEWRAAGDFFEIFTLKNEFSGYFQYFSLYITVLVTVLHLLHIMYTHIMYMHISTGHCTCMFR